MAYLAIKKVNGKHYAYMQESYREGGQVRTRTVEYLGAVEPAVAQQVRATRRQLGQADMAALVASVRAAAQASFGTETVTDPIKEPPSKPQTASQGPSNETLITTANEPQVEPPRWFHWPGDLPSYKVGATALRARRSGSRIACRPPGIAMRLIGWG